MIVVSVPVTVTVIGSCLSCNNTERNNGNQDYSGNYDCGNNVEIASSGAIMSCTIHISNHLPVSGLEG